MGKNQNKNEKDKVTFIDLFAGAGGFSEGFLQAEENGKEFKFLLASDINENCELTHLYRYNRQLGLKDVKFLRKDIQSPDFIDELREEVGQPKVDVICGGPPCQSFSLAGRRRAFDIKDDLFSNYLEVVRELKPKYFVMENVAALLTKENGKFEERIVNEINSIINVEGIEAFQDFLTKLYNKLKNQKLEPTDLDLLRTKIKDEFELAKGNGKGEELASLAENQFKNMTRGLGYHASKTDKNINTIRHALKGLTNRKEVEETSRNVMQLKKVMDVDNDHLVKGFNSFLDILTINNLQREISKALEETGKNFKLSKRDIEQLETILDHLAWSFADTLDRVEELSEKADLPGEFRKARKAIQRYQLSGPHKLNASDYGVPQNRIRAVFIGCRFDQKFIKDIPSTVEEKDKVTVEEALWDLDILEENELEKKTYGDKKRSTKKRDKGGKPSGNGKTYAKWSREGRLRKDLKPKKPEYYKNLDEYGDGNEDGETAKLHNHQASKHNDTVKKRLEIILKAKGYSAAEDEIEKKGIKTDKRNYQVLALKGQAPTVVTLPDDFIHYDKPRAPTVREMARLQSFDDSFVFQGKRNTGGHRRKDEVPQFTLVGNAVAPLMARAIGNVILENIK